jgi:S1-C subfamily serine protease
VALGYALALEGGPTVTSGIVSSLNRTIQVQDPGCTSCQNGTRTYTDIIQTDAAINHGNSGGPLVNMAGQVVGINSAGDDQAQNIGFAIAVDSAKDTIAKAEANPLAPAAFLGVSTQGVTPAMAFQLGLKVQQGVYVVATTSGGPAEQAGINQGDVIVAVNGTSVKTSDDLGSNLDALAPGQTASVEVVTPSGSHTTIGVTLGSRPLPAQLP